MASLKSVATCGILSVGDMGAAIARLLTTNNYKVVTNASDRSQATQARAKSNNINLVSSDSDLVEQSDYIFSIVPPRDSLATAQRIADVSRSTSRTSPLYFIDLNAISPRSSRQVDDLFDSIDNVRFIDGGIIGAPPSRKTDGSWSRPSIPVSGPHELASAEPSGAHLAETLNIRHVNSFIGSATGLKMCFASLTKGYTALALQSFTTAHRLGVLNELKTAMSEFNPAGLKSAEGGLPSMCPKAYRWVEEMRQIGETFEADGGFEESENIFRSVAEVYELVANGTELGSEVVGQRKRGKTADDVAAVVTEGLERRKVKTE